MSTATTASLFLVVEGMTGEGSVVLCLKATTASPYQSSLITSVSPAMMMADS